MQITLTFILISLITLIKYTKKHKIYLYKEDFAAFTEILQDMTAYVLNNKGEEVISERHQKDFKREYNSESSEETTQSEKSFTDIDFDDI